MNTVHYSVHGAVAVLTLDHPPVNALSQRMRKAIRTYLELANADAAIGAVIIIGSQKAFSAGADIKEARTPQGIEENRIGMKVQDRVDKPIVAAIGGYALGGGMEFALCSHFRVASPGARLGLPEVKIGRVPSSGGTQRLPRLIGVAAAARMMLHGELVSSEQAKEIGLIDEIVEGDLLDGALRYADRLIAEHKGPRRIRNMSAKLDNAAAFFASQRAELERTRRGYCAPLWILECLEAAVALPFDEGKAIEEKNGDLARDSLQAKALQYAFMAERAAAKIPDVPAETVAREIRQVAVIGAGATGAGIATCFACSGIPVRLIDGEPEALVRGLAAIRDNDNTASSSGINIFRLKLLAFVISAVVTALAGAVFFIFQGYIAPAGGFSMRWTMTMILATVIGGISTEGGPIIGTMIIVFLHFVLARYAGISLVIQGTLLIIIMLLAPQGIMGFFRKTRTHPHP